MSFFSFSAAMCRSNVGRAFISRFGLPNIQMFLQPNLMISSRRRRGWHWTSWTHWELPKHHTKKVWPLKKGLGLWYHFCYSSNSIIVLGRYIKQCKKLEVVYVEYYALNGKFGAFVLSFLFLRRSFFPFFVLMSTMGGAVLSLSNDLVGAKFANLAGLVCY